jgi:hypothetical protein
VPTNTYYAKKLISLLTMGVKKIHACRNHYILYRGDDYKDLESYPNYEQRKTTRWKRIGASVSIGKKQKKTKKQNT